MRLAWYFPRERKPPARRASARTLTARMRSVSGETVRRLPTLGRRSGLGAGLAAALAAGRRAKGCSATAEGAAGAAGSTVAVSIPDAIKCFDLREIRIDVLEFLSQTL